MREVTPLLDQAAAGDALATGRLLPLVCDELHRMAQAQMAGERPGQTLQQTALAPGITPAQAKDDWSFARAWMHRELRRMAREVGS